ncbi:hypothetical protein HPP92_028611 [Vanilla planifolia]|uniref:Uncharacterized protein n=1 Tax=Vanilla planifolia TaxID=51239 RepID=A0A835U2A4_VANPL|nr:hypothetical protein HPP92_028611 [Vanilla planifolia]KAG0446932.1 hypothetical protein HPP92_028605 [Vanilla planifolia]
MRDDAHVLEVDHGSKVTSAVGICPVAKMLQVRGLAFTLSLLYSSAGKTNAIFVGCLIDSRASSGFLPLFQSTNPLSGYNNGLIQSVML